MPTAVLTAFPDEYDLDITKRVQSRFNAAILGGQLPYLRYYDVDTTDLYIVKSDSYSNFQAMGVWSDGADVPLDTPEKKWDSSLTMAFYGRGFKVSRKMVQYHRLNQVRKWANSLGNSAIATARTKHALPLINGFTTFTAPDAVALFSASHTSSGAANRSNLLAAASALSVAALDAIQQVGHAHVTYRGLSSPIEFDQLIFPSELRKTARQAIGSPQEPGTTDNQINVEFGAWEPTLEPELTSATAWFVRKKNFGSENLVSYVGMAFQSRSYQEPSNESLVHYGAMDFTYGAEDWEGTAASAGA
jgi:hypothetical protein